jgi:uncharacterized protein (DUF2141 family)
MKTVWLAVMLVLVGAAAAWGEEKVGAAADTLAAWAPIRVEVTGLRNDSGVVKMALYASREGFPSKPEKAMFRLDAKVVAGRAAGEFSSVPEGEYAVAVIHDENQNGRFDTNFLGMPREGVGVSNNAKGKMGPPAYEDARFRHGREPQTLSIKILYML